MIAGCLVAAVVCLLVGAALWFLGPRPGWRTANRFARFLDWSEIRVAPPVPAVFEDTPDWRKAAHEAGHAVVAWSCTMVQTVHEVTIAAPDGGYVKYADAYRPSEHTDARWCDTVIALAGVAGEVAVYGRVRSGPASADLRCAMEHARQLSGVAPPWRLDAVTRSAVVLPFDAMFEEPPSREQIAVLRHAYLIARHILCVRDPSHRHLMVTLHAKRVLNEEDLTGVLGTRAIVKWFGHKRPSFVVPGMFVG